MAGAIANLCTSSERHGETGSFGRSCLPTLLGSKKTAATSLLAFLSILRQPSFHIILSVPQEEAGTLPVAPLKQPCVTWAPIQ